MFLTHLRLRTSEQFCDKFVTKKLWCVLPPCPSSTSIKARQRRARRPATGNRAYCHDLRAVPLQMPKGQYNQRGGYSCTTCARTFFSKGWFQRHVLATQHNSTPIVRQGDARYQPYRRGQDAVQKYDISIIIADMHVKKINNVPLRVSYNFHCIQPRGRPP